MGKKLKKDDKAALSDVFDPLLVESKQAATVVIMLDSPEEEVVARACEAIFKFVDKSDENKKELFELGACEKLFRLAQSDDRIVKRNATMALGLLSCHVDVRKWLRKQDFLMDALINLLQPEQDILIHEFVALLLAKLTLEYQGKAIALNSAAMSYLVPLLSSVDPDVQKNTVETLLLLLHDYRGKSTLRELQGFQPLLELLDSEYPIIQQLTLQCLTRAAEDSENRGVLRECGGVTRMIEFIGNAVYSEQHVYALQCLANCLDDNATVELIKVSGALSKFIALVMDEVPPEGGDDGSKKGKKADAPQPPGSAKGKGKDKVKAKGKEATGGDELVPTLPVVKENAALIIARCARNAVNRQLLHESNMERMLFALLNKDEENIQAAAATAMAVMSSSDLCKDALNALEALPVLVRRATTSDSSAVRERATLALQCITERHPRNIDAVAEAGSLDKLLVLLHDSNERTVVNAVGLVNNLISEQHVRANVLSLGVLQQLLGLLASPSDEVQARALVTLAGLFCEAEARQAATDHIAEVVDKLRANNEEVMRNASLAVVVLCQEEHFATLVTVAGGLDALHGIQNSESRRNVITATAIERLLSADLPAKYAAMSRLEPTDTIKNGFVDVGPLASEEKLLSLEEYCRAAVDQRRPILLVNVTPAPRATPAPSETPVPSHEEQSAPARNSRSATKKGSKTAAAATKPSTQQQPHQVAPFRKGAIQRATPDPSEHEHASSEDTPWTMPPDDGLCQLVAQVEQEVAPLPDAWHQSVALAQLVAAVYGGARSPAQAVQLCHELSLSEVKFANQSNVVPLGSITLGAFQHRALLFKVLADRIGLPASLTRGSYNKYWNTVHLIEDVSGSALPPREYLVDLMHQPGRLLKLDSLDAASYMRI